MQSPITQPTMIESRLRRDLIMPMTPLMPGIVPACTSSQSSRYKGREGPGALSTPCMRALIPEIVIRWRPNSARVSYACL